MAKQKRKPALPGIIESGREWAVRIAVHAAVFVLFAVVVTLLIQAFLYRSDYFRLAVVETKNTPLDNATIAYINNQVLNAYKGRNIFTISLKDAARNLAGKFPDAKDVTVRIALPDKLTVVMQFRRAVALVRGPRTCPVDDDGVVLLNANEALFKFLPLIEGIEIRPNERTARRGVPYRNLQVALALLRELKRSKVMADYGVTVIDASDAKAMSFTMKNGVRVKIGYEDFGTRIETLKKTLRDPRMVMDRIDYIDVRFNDVVIGPREV